MIFYVTMCTRVFLCSFYLFMKGTSSNEGFAHSCCAVEQQERKKDSENIFILFFVFGEDKDNSIKYMKFHPSHVHFYFLCFFINKSKCLI